MSAQPATYDSAHAAVRILEAAQSGDLAGLETELDRPRSWPADLPPETAERWELLDAVACQMRSSLERMRRRTTDRLEGAEVHLRLLRHLAAGASGPI